MRVNERVWVGVVGLPAFLVMTVRINKERRMVANLVKVTLDKRRYYKI